MGKNIEIEAKFLIQKKDFLKLEEALNLFIKDGWEQINEYFDTPNNDISSSKSMLRIRTIDGKRRELTIKRPLTNGLEETNVDLSERQYQEFIKIGHIDLLDLGKYQLQKQGELRTIRNSKPYLDGEIFLDENHYQGIIDYEIEYEVQTSLERAQEQLKELFRRIGITDYKVSISKYKRCLEAIKNK